MDYKLHLAKDKKLRPLVHNIVLEPLKVNKNIFVAMVKAVVSQQLSTKVADVIFKRFLALYATKNPTPAQVVATEYDTLKAIGLSNQKTQYIFNIANFALANAFTYTYINKLNDDSLVAYLTQIKGIGKWTVEMLMMFTLGRENVFSLGDYGLQMGAKQLYQLDDSNKKLFLQQIEQLSKQWEPYKTFAARLIWRYKDAT